MINSMLIVDDSQAITSLLGEMASQLGILDVMHVNSGDKALELVRQDPFRFQLILLDLAMPDMDGVELLNRLSHSSYFGALAIASGMSEKIIKLAANTARENHLHMIGAIRKPIQEDEFRRLIDKASLRLKYEQHQHQMTLTEVSEALRDNRMLAYFQPIVNLHTGHIHALETLPRIRQKHNPESHLPADFLPAIEKNHLMDRLTVRLLQLSLLDFKIFRNKSALNTLKMTLNLSPNQLMNSELPGLISAMVENSGLTCSDIILEVSEIRPLDDTRQMETLNRFSIKGFELALDDFGSGFTTISQIRDLPFNYIKLDKSLIYQVHADHFSQVMVQSLHDICQQSQALIIAEGVENSHELNWLERFDPMLVQGFVISRPKPIEELMRWQQAWQKMTVQHRASEATQPASATTTNPDSPVYTSDRERSD